MGFGLLSAMEQWMKVQEKAIAFFTDFKIIYAAEIILFYALIYFVAKVLRENEATKLMLFYWFLLLVGGAMRIFDDGLVTKDVFLLYVGLISTFMLIMFNVEVKKSLWDVHTKDIPLLKEPSGNAEIRSDAETDRCISDIIKALQNMSKNNIGALVVLSKGNLPKQVLQSGVQVDAEVSTPLIESVFFPKAPLHDGAMIINGHKIQAASCFLPLTQKTSYPKEYGTRHRAAIGITEVANVTSLVVSEETGIISIVHRGNVTRYADYDMLMDALKEYYCWQESSVEKKYGRK